MRPSVPFAVLEECHPEYVVGQGSNGTTDHLAAFLEFRRTELQRLFDDRKP
jgi:hypothetical protein